MKQEKQLGKRAAQWVLSLALSTGLTFVLFIILPLTQKISEKMSDDSLVRTLAATSLPPPPPPPEPEPEKPKEEEEPEPDLEQPEPEPLSLDQLELAINPGMGFGGGAGIAMDLGLDRAVNKGLSDADDVFSMGDLDSKPKPVFQSPPRYPSELRKEKKKGQVYLLFVVDKEGRVQNAKVQKSTHPAFEKAALEAVKQWKFEPATRAGQKVMAKMGIPITFDPGA